MSKTCGTCAHAIHDEVYCPVYDRRCYLDDAPAGHYGSCYEPLGDSWEQLAKDTYGMFFDFARGMPAIEGMYAGDSLREIDGRIKALEGNNGNNQHQR